MTDMTHSTPICYMKYMKDLAGLSTAVCTFSHDPPHPAKKF